MEHLGIEESLVSTLYVVVMELSKGCLSAAYSAAAGMMNYLTSVQGHQLEEAYAVQRRKDDDLNRLMKAHEEARKKNSENIDRMIQEGDELIRTLKLSANHPPGGNNYHWQRETYNQQCDRQNLNKLTIEMELPEDPKDLGGTLQRFWSTLRTHAATYTQQNEDRSPSAIETMDDPIPQTRLPIAASAPLAETENCVVPYQRHSLAASSLPVETWWNEKKMKSKEKEMQSKYVTPDLSYEDQLEIAYQRSLKDSQEAKDLIVAQRLQEEERRLMAFRYHEDVARKDRGLHDYGS